MRNLSLTIIMKNALSYNYVAQSLSFKKFLLELTLQIEPKDQ